MMALNRVAGVLVLLVFLSGCNSSPTQLGKSTSITEEPGNTVTTVSIESTSTIPEPKPEFVEEAVDYDEISDLAEVNGKLAYKAVDGDQQFIVYAGQEEKKYDFVGPPVEVNGKLAYRAGNEANQQFIVYGGQEGGKYFCTGEPTEVNGKLAYSVRSRGTPVLPDGIGTTLTYTYFVVYDGKEGKRYRSSMGGISNIGGVGGKLVYEAIDGNKWFIVYDGHESKRYDSPGIIAEVNGKLVFVAEKDDQWIIVRER